MSEVCSKTSYQFNINVYVKKYSIHFLLAERLAEILIICQEQKFIIVSP